MKNLTRNEFLQHYKIEDKNYIDYYPEIVFFHW